MMRLSESIREWMGWCPHPAMVPLRKDVFTMPGTDTRNMPIPTAYANDRAIVDYARTGVSVPWFIGTLFAISGVLVVMFLVMREVRGLFLLSRHLLPGLAFLAAIVFFLRDFRRARLEITQDALIITRFLHRTVVIPRDTIATIETRAYVPSFPIRLQEVLIFLVIPLSSAGNVVLQYLDFTAGETAFPVFFSNLVFFAGLNLFYLALYYHSRIRSDYARILAVTTNTGRIALVYDENPEEIARTLERSA